MIEIIYFLSWTFLLYIVHILVHHIPYLKTIHHDHHLFIIKEFSESKEIKNLTNWHWNNIFLFNDTPISSLDLWITEVIPTLIFCYITNHWWIFLFYYVWAAFIQERIEHNPKIDLYPFTSGKWHLIHHRNFKKNYGLFHPLWDKIFDTELKL